jgi:hypothetical protein
MKKLILLIFILLSIGTANAQGDRIYQRDSLTAAERGASFYIATKHNFNTFTLINLASTDSVKVYHLNESGDSTPVSVRDLNTYTDLNTNLITNLSGNREFLVLNPNIYRLLIVANAGTVASKSILVRRRGNNLK